MKTLKNNAITKSENCNKLVWLDCRTFDKNKNNILSLIYNLSYNYILINREDYGTLKPPQKMNLIVEIKNVEELKGLEKSAIIYSDSPEILKNSKKAGLQTALLCKIEDESTMNYAWQKGMNYDFLIVKLTSATNIPLELLIAKLQSTNTVLIKKVNSVQEAEIVEGVMEIGSDGVLFKTDKTEEIMAMDKFIKKQKTSKIQLVSGKVIDVQHAGMGYRACIDTTSILKKNEGMLVGSTSEGGLMVSSETHYLPYMELRPFRVNAGAVHSYVWCPNEKTSYITELKGGKVVLCVDTDGNTREVVVGRIKTEVRPLLKIEVEAAGKKLNAFVQDDWHIRIFGAKGEPLNASEIKIGDELLVYVCNSGRHVGIKIDENIEES